MIILRKITILATVIIFLASCSSKKKIVAVETPQSSELINIYENSALNFDELALHSNLKVRGPLNMGFKGEFRMKKGQKIWGSFRKFGFEAVKLMITPDSIFLINNLQSSYAAESIKSFDKFSSIPLEFEDIEQMLLGGPYAKGGYVQKSDSTIYQLLKVDKEAVAVNHLFNKKNQVVQSTLELLGKQMNMVIQQSDFRPLGNTSTPYSKEFFVTQGDNETYLKFDTREINLDVKNQYPFKIPSSFSRMSF